MDEPPLLRPSTLTAALRDYLKHNALQCFTVAELARAVQPALGREPSLMAVSRVMGTESAWAKLTIDGKVAFKRL